MDISEIVKGKNIALYGLSTETERTLGEWNGKYNVIGLLDGFRKEGEQFGYPIVDIDDVVKRDNVIIIVIARPGSCKAIAKRIGEVCKENNVGLFDIRGKDLLADTRVVFDFKSINGYTKDELISQIKTVDVVSFDLFDTLIVRNVISSGDVIEIVDSRLKEKGIIIPNFVSKRIGTEKNLSRGKAPRLETIYEEILRDEEGTVLEADELADLEYKTDIGLIRARDEVVDFIKAAKQFGKRVYVTSESYYSKSEIEHIMSVNNIQGVDDVIVSCEYDTGKTDRLFDKLIEVAGTSNILHIGDDIVADIESAKRHGLKAFRIYSSSELLDSVGGLTIATDKQSLSDRIKTGMFTSHIFNSPFQFEDEGKRIHVNDSCDIGYLFAAPMIMDFAEWFGEQVKENELKNTWFCARDGYLLQKIYKLIYPDEKTEYFLTSRISAIRAGVENVADIEYVASMKYSGETSDNLMTRFGIRVDELPDNQIKAEKSGLLRYSDAILEVAKIKKANNLKYIDGLKMQDGGIALFDFVAKGTCQMYIQRLVSAQIMGLYFLQLEPEFMKSMGLNIKSFYTEEEKDSSAIFDNYYILETLLTSPDPSIDEFDRDGVAVYAKETRKEKDIKCFLRAQEGILAYIKKYLSICPRSEMKINKKLDEAFLVLIHNVEVKDKDFLSLIVEDPFFNRMTNITDVL